MYFVVRKHMTAMMPSVFNVLLAQSLLDIAFMGELLRIFIDVVIFKRKI